MTHKLRSTVSILITLGLARTFGVYDTSIWDGQMHYARYRWRGRLWAFPTSPIKEDYPQQWSRIRWGFKSKTQLPLFMIWREDVLEDQVIYATVLFNSNDYRLTRI